MKLRKEIIVTCCVLIASFGIVLTGCGNGSGEKKEEKYVESNSEKNTETNSGKNVENNAEKSTQSNTNKNVDSNNSKDAEKLYVGTWEAKVVEYDGEEYNVREIMGAFEATFHKDGTCSLLHEGDTTGGKWEPAEEGVKITENTGVEYTLPYQDEKLIMEIPIEEKSVIYYFEKKKK